VDAGHRERTAKVRSSDVSARIGGCVREGRSRSLHSSILVFAGPGLFLDIVEQNLIEGAERGDVCARTLLADYERLHSILWTRQRAFSETILENPFPDAMESRSKDQVAASARTGYKTTSVPCPPLVSETLCPSCSEEMGDTTVCDDLSICHRKLGWNREFAFSSHRMPDEVRQHGTVRET
jgi:hypothetical protein